MNTKPRPRGSRCDANDRLRYVVGQDAAAIIVTCRTKSEQEFMGLVRAEFGLAEGRRV